MEQDDYHPKGIPPMSQTATNEVLDMLDASENSFEVRVGGQRVEGACGLLGALAAAKEMMYGNVFDATTGEFTMKMRVRMENRDGGPHLVVEHQDFLYFCPDEKNVQRDTLLVDGEPIVDRREHVRTDALRRASDAWGMERAASAVV